MPRPTIALTLSVNIIDNGRGKLTCHKVWSDLVPYLNDVWNQANIEIHLKFCRLVRALPYSEPLGSRDRVGEGTFNRKLLTDPSSHFNVFVIEKDDHLGYTMMEAIGANWQSYIILSEKLTHWDTCFAIERMANTLAHEIGHVLGLDHVNSPNSLMQARANGAIPRYGADAKLSNREIERARHQTKRLIPWDFHRGNQLDNDPHFLLPLERVEDS
jgi:hypothetical protein